MMMLPFVPLWSFTFLLFGLLLFMLRVAMTALAVARLRGW